MKPVRSGLPALLAALLAVICQLALGSLAQARMASTAPASIHICTWPGTPAPERPGAPHPAMDCGHCPLCAGLLAAAVPPPNPAALPPTPLIARQTLSPATRRAPPLPAVTAAEPRGPPALI